MSRYSPPKAYFYRRRKLKAGIKVDDLPPYSNVGPGQRMLVIDADSNVSGAPAVGGGPYLVQVVASSSGWAVV